MRHPIKVFRSWSRHAKDDVHRHPSLLFYKHSAPVVKLRSLYIVGDTRGATECYLSGHGGYSRDDYAVDCRSFTVPDKVTINFFQPHGSTMRFATCDLRNGAPHGADDGFQDLVYQAGDRCTNYILTKDQGRHYSKKADKVTELEMDYLGAQVVAKDMGVVIVTVRQRWFHCGVTLKSAIADVRKACPKIKTFNCLFCRSTDLGDVGLSWDASTGEWDALADLDI